VTSPLLRSLPDYTQHSQDTEIYAAGRIQTCNPSRRAAADPDCAATGIGRQNMLTENMVDDYAAKNSDDSL